MVQGSVTHLHTMACAKAWKVLAWTRPASGPTWFFSRCLSSVAAFLVKEITLMWLALTCKADRGPAGLQDSLCRHPGTVSGCDGAPHCEKLLEQLRPEHRQVLAYL